MKFRPLMRARSRFDGMAHPLCCVSVASGSPVCAHRPRSTIHFSGENKGKIKGTTTSRQVRRDHRLATSLSSGVLQDWRAPRTDRVLFAGNTVWLINSRPERLQSPDPQH
jgi:hypothetical protein